MALKKIKLGDYLLPYKEKCGVPNLTPYEISGVNRDKEFFEPSRQTGEDTTNYQNVPPQYFACNLMHVGRDKVLPIAYNHTNTIKHVSPAYSIFCIKNNSDLLDQYFFIYLKSNERDRYFWFNTDGSVRDGMTWEDLCNVELTVPPLSIQQKYVDVYNAMLANQKSYERGLDDLKLVCDAYIEDLRRKNSVEKIEKYLQAIDLKNSNLKYSLENVKGISIEKRFIETKANMDNVPLNNYKIVEKDCFAFNPNTARMGEKLSIALNLDNTILVSSIYPVFSVNCSVLLPKYLFMWLKRSEFDRYVRFNSWGSAREIYDYNDICEFQIPIPDIKIQQCIVDIFSSYQKRYNINEKLKTQIKDICPILIKGSIEEAMEAENVHTAG
mgnify:CR=1 FL=1